MKKSCAHLSEAKDFPLGRRVCEDCIKIGDNWVHLRQCLVCGHIGCCDSSKNKHAAKHHHATNHAIIRSAEPGEDWGWCYPDEAMIDFSRGVEHARVSG